MNALRTFVLIGSLAGLEALSAQTASSPRTVQPAPSSVGSAAPMKESALAESLPPAKLDKLTLLGGTIDSVNQVRDELLIKTFGGGHIKVLFDERTRIYLDRMTIGHQRDLRHGQRIHLDAVLEGTRVFAQNIYVLGQPPTIESKGQVESYQASSAELIMRDFSLQTTVRVHLLPGTVVRHNDRFISPIDIQPGSLISVAFQPEGNGRVNASMILVAAQVGETFTFAGRVAHLDMRSQLVVLETLSDHNTYEIYFDSARVPGADLLREGVDAVIAAKFDGTRYVASTLSINP